MRKACRGAELDALFRQRQVENWRDRFPPSGPRPRKCGSSSLRVELDSGVPAFRPGSQPIKGGHGRSVVLEIPQEFSLPGASTLDAHIHAAQLRDYMSAFGAPRAPWSI